MEQKINVTGDAQSLSEEMQGFGDINSDADIPGNSHLTDPEENSVVEKLSAELDEQKDKYIRLFAEFDNYKRRNAKERIELVQTAGREVITSLLDVLDDSERAEKQLQSSSNLDEIKKGVQLVFGKLKTTLQAKGLRAMESVHTDFDVEKHEAITESTCTNGKS